MSTAPEVSSPGKPIAALRALSSAALRGLAETPSYPLCRTTRYSAELDSLSDRDQRRVVLRLSGVVGDPASDAQAGRRSSVTCKLPPGLIGKLQADTENYTPITREEEGVVMACGTRLAGRRPAIVLQNSSFGNSANAILSLLNYYRVPVVLVVSHRGSDGEPIEAQRMMGNAIKDLLNVSISTK
jgi:sulfopyruvate decarboxylase TPP-binding subunit